MLCDMIHNQIFHMLLAPFIGLDSQIRWVILESLIPGVVSSLKVKSFAFMISTVIVLFYLSGGGKSLNVSICH